MRSPEEVGAIHFVGIGGIGMSGIAEVLNNLGYSVQGSDIGENANVLRLRDMGIKVFVGHQASNVDKAAVLVVSSAIKPDNDELVAARAQYLPIVRRAEMLAELMRLKSCVTVAGTHGKTTTTSLIACILEAAEFDASVINGGIINDYGTNAKLGSGEWMVVEADESDGSFMKLPAEVAVVTNIDPEHLDHYGDFDTLKDAFKSFVEKVPFYGFAVMCIDHPEVQALVGRIDDKRIVTYGESRQADIRFLNLTYKQGDSLFDIEIHDRKTGETTVIDNVRLPMPGKHNVANATAAIAVAVNMGVSSEAIKQGLAEFKGVKRRFTKTGMWNGIAFFDDYAHHPVEIGAVLKAARDASERNVVAIVQPHRYTRLRDLFNEFATCFNDADMVIVCPVFEAGEAPIDGIDHIHLADAMRRNGHRHVVAIENEDELPKLVADNAKANDFVVFCGAGSITNWANALPQTLNEEGF
ncbi:MAG: UDP-N-acetylmuramate--L-alanine ligase [Rhizobiales bacterium]|nr:UDP-N-acetylmuramate--L-alanine ligase [Hyphomicrobiales bacterium]NRB13994.1 UDP-N-acetylmuramate--L-alanine ligase [Hyphomicrobiales bacterium]